MRVPSLRSNGFSRSAAIILLVFSGAALHAHSDEATRDLDASGTEIQPGPANPEVQQALAQISTAQIQSHIEKLVSFGTRNTLSSMEKGIPSGQGVSAAADWIESEFKRYSAACGGCLEVKRDTFTQTPEPPPQGRIPGPTTIANVYAVLRGSDPRQASRMVLVTGHYDSRNSNVLDAIGVAPGANDDASGVAVSLECARVLSKLKFPSTLIFAAVAGEEQGLNGSKHLAQFAKGEGWQLEGVLNNDIVGGNTTPGDSPQNKTLVRVFSEGIPAAATPDEIRRIAALGLESDSPSRELTRAIDEIGKSYQAGQFRPVLIFRRDRYLRAGDHSSFNQEGFPAVRFTEWREDFNHQHQNVRSENGVEYGDLLKFVDFNYVLNVARLNAAVMATLADAPPPPVNVRIVTHELDNNSTLKWEPGSGAPPSTRYEIVWRETTAPEWQRRLSIPPDPNAPESHSYTLPVSKDNVIFGVRAVNSSGQSSPAVVPFPER